MGLECLDHCLRFHRTKGISGRRSLRIHAASVPIRATRRASQKFNPPYKGGRFLVSQKRGKALYPTMVPIGVGLLSRVLPGRTCDWAADGGRWRQENAVEPPHNGGVLSVARPTNPVHILKTHHPTKTKDGSLIHVFVLQLTLVPVFRLGVSSSYLYFVLMFFV